MAPFETSQSPEQASYTGRLIPMLGRLASGHVDDVELLEVIRWALADPRKLAALREYWPTEKLPIVADYLCVARLGQGASGVVFKAIRLGKVPDFVALKILQFTAQEEEERFQEREIAILKDLDLPRVARYLDSGQSGGTRYLAMELVDGIPLDDYLEKHAPTLEEKLALFQRVCGVVSGLHADGVIHRDLKPKHVLIDQSGQPWIVDFGLSAVRGGDWPSRVRRAQTELGHIVGTVKYMSPEQAWGGLLHVDHRTDLWALGIMLYEIASGGDYPYEVSPIGDLTGHDALLHRIQTEAPKNPKLPAPYAGPLSILISRCLAYEPEQRIESAEALARDLRHCLARETIETRALSLAYRMRRIAFGLAANWRFGLWLAVTGFILSFLVLYCLAFPVQYIVEGEDFGADTRRNLAALSQYKSPHGFVVVGWSGESRRRVPEIARRLGMDGVTGDILTWRPVNGHLMEKLALAKPRAVIWDVFLIKSRPEDDHAFVKGALALRDAGISLILGTRDFEDDGRAALSPTITDPLDEYARYGISLARDQVGRPGEFVVAVRRGEMVYPSSALSVFTALVQPACTVTLDWPRSSQTLQVIYHPKAIGAPPPTLDRINVTRSYPLSENQFAVREDDWLACKSFPLRPLQEWKRSAVAYEELLETDVSVLQKELVDKIVVFGDVQEPSLLNRFDQKEVRYEDGKIENVPGCYLVADQIRGLVANRSMQADTHAQSSLKPPVLTGVIAVSLLACWLCSWKRWAGRITLPPVRMALIASLLVGSAICLKVMTASQSQYVIYSAMIGFAGASAMAAACLIEFARNYHLMLVRD